MKKKDLSKKLSFTKQTIAALDNNAQGQLLGGAELAADKSTGLSICITQCDYYTDCYNISRCMTVCGGPFC